MTTSPTNPSRRRLVQGLGAAVLAAPVAGAFSGAAAPATAAPGIPRRPGFATSGRRLLDANGREFVMRGINHPHTWYPQETDSFSEISELGANTVRVVLSNGVLFPGQRTSTRQVADAVRRCKQNRLVAVLEVHDTTGYPENAGAISLAAAVEYWKTLRGVLRGEERYVIINLGNEPYGNVGNGTVMGWVEDSVAAVRAMRRAGFTHTLMVDAPNWGQDWTGTMSRFGGDVLAADPLGNTLLSVHMYEVYRDPASIGRYLDTFVANDWPVVIGEFGWKHGGQVLDPEAMMTAAHERGIGYIGWSYSGNSGGVEHLDIVEEFDPDQLTEWGSRLLDHPAGIRATAEPASVYTD